MRAPPNGIAKRPLQELTNHYRETPLKTIRATADVSKLRGRRLDKLVSILMLVVLLCALMRAMFKQSDILEHWPSARRLSYSRRGRTGRARAR